MIKTIELKGSIARLLDKEPFLLPDNLILEFKHIGYDLSNAFITLRNGEKIIKEKLTKQYEVPVDVLFEGDLHVKIEMYLHGEKAKEWTGAPIRVIETEKGLQLNDLLYDIEKKVNNCVQISTFNKVVVNLNNLIENHNKLADTVSDIKENF